MHPSLKVQIANQPWGGGAGCIGSFTRKSMFFMFYSYRVLPFPAKNVSVCVCFTLYSAGNFTTVTVGVAFKP